ncbi:TPA: BspA family leucine-rich repeat surface protein, partial [Campylobacter coli]|nr:BspA family leucine-rich repeat surface protein [Campylobacter coli]
VENMKGMFYNNKSFNQPLASWDVSNVKDMSDMFYGSAQNPLPYWYKG